MSSVDDHVLTRNEAARTAQLLPLKRRYVVEKDPVTGSVSIRLQTNEEAIKNRDESYKTCRMCKNTETDRILSTWELKPFMELYDGRPFRAYSCFCCGYKWSHEVT